MTIEAPGAIVSIAVDCKGLDAKYVAPWGTADNGTSVIRTDSLFSEVTILDMLNSSGQSIFDIYYQLNLFDVLAIFIQVFLLFGQYKFFH